MSIIAQAIVKQRLPFIPAGLGLLQRKCDKCRKKKKQLLQRSSQEQAGPSAIPPIVNDVLNSPGQPLDSETRAFFEPRFGHDFGKVRVHTDSLAAKSAEFVAASAYTADQDIAFGLGKYAPESNNGKLLLAHELAHVIQGYQGRTQTESFNPRVSHPSEPIELEADQTAKKIVAMREVLPIKQDMRKPIESLLHDNIIVHREASGDETDIITQDKADTDEVPAETSKKEEGQNNTSSDQPEELQGKSGSGSPTCSENPTFTPKSKPPVTVQGNTIDDFVKNINTELGNPHMAASWIYDKIDFDKTTGKVTQVNLELEWSIVRPRWGGGHNVTPLEEQLINKVVELIRVHEELHRDKEKGFASAAVCAVLGKPATLAIGTIKKYACDAAKAQEALDAKEGKVKILLGPNGMPADVELEGFTTKYPC